MSHEFVPLVGDWYSDDQGNRFKVILIDETEGIIEVQHYDGAVEPIDMDSWYERELTPGEPSEDWSGPYDDLIADDLDATESAMRPHEWGNPLDTLETDD